MVKKYIVRLSEAERQTLHQVIKKLAGSSMKVRRAQMLLKADVNGLAWKDQQICEAFGCRRQTIENLRKRLVEAGFEQTLNGKQRDEPPTPKLLDGRQEAQIIALRLGEPPKGYANWSLRLLAKQVVALEIVESISYQTLRRMLKKIG